MMESVLLSKKDGITLIPGGGGFIGRSLIKKLLQCSDREIVVIGRSLAPKVSLPVGVRYVSGDIQNADFIAPLIDQACEVIDLAYGTVPKTSFDDPLIDVISNLPASVTLQRMCSGPRSKLRRYMLVSSGGTVYGHSKYLPIDEAHPTNPISPYGISKLVTEKYATFFCHMSGLPLVIARPANPYGLGQLGQKLQGFIGAAMHAVQEGSCIEVFGERGTIRDYLYIDDLVDGLIAVLNEGEIGEVYNIGSGVGHDNMDVLSILRSVAGDAFGAVQIKHGPARPFDVQSNVLSTSKLTAVSGWMPQIELRQGMQMTWQQVLQSNTSEYTVHQ